MSLELTVDRSILVRVMAWCRRQQANTWANVDPDLCLHIASLCINKLSKLCSREIASLRICNWRIHLFTTMMLYWMPTPHRTFCRTFIKKYKIKKNTVVSTPFIMALEKGFYNLGSIYFKETMNILSHGMFSVRVYTFLFAFSTNILCLVATRKPGTYLLNASVLFENVFPNDGWSVCKFSITGCDFALV